MVLDPTLNGVLARRKISNTIDIFLTKTIRTRELLDELTASRGGWLKMDLKFGKEIDLLNCSVLQDNSLMDIEQYDELMVQQTVAACLQ